MLTKRRTLLWFSLFLVLISIAASGYLTHLHIRVNTDPSYVAGCDVSATFRCSDVAMSRFGTFFTVPTAVWGLVGCVVFLFFIVWGLRGTSETRWPSGLYWLLNLINLGVSVAFAFIAEVIIGALCIGCVTLYITSLILFGLATWLLVEDRGSVYRDLTGLLKNRPVLVFGVATAVVSGSLIAFYPKYWKVPVQSECDGLPAGFTGDGSCWIGAPFPVLEIIEFSDYRCPFCRLAHARMRELVKQYPDRIRLTHKHFPLDTACNPAMQRQLHANACQMAKIAYCAGVQGRFWDANDRLFSLPNDVTIDPEHIASELELESQAFLTCLDSSAAAEHVQKDVEEGIRLRISATPTFIIDGELYTGRIPEEVVRQYFDE
jgi:protein-disulfide isomerase/uncharacterized membrane protein